MQEQRELSFNDSMIVLDSYCIRAEIRQLDRVRCP